MSVKELYGRIISDARITKDNLAIIWKDNIDDVMCYANKLREDNKGKKVNLCSIINAKSGKCSEDCKFCSQSGHYKTDVESYPFVSEKELEKGFQKADQSFAGCYGIVTSGRSVDEDDIKKICSFMRFKKQRALKISASLGELPKESLKKLKDSGIKKYHHNLETAKSYFPNICSTHKYEDKLCTVKTAKEIGFEVCCGGIFGLGETREQRVELAFALRELDVDSIPLNFLNPIPGTPFENNKKLEPEEILRTIAMFRFVLPGKDISVCGGREINLGDCQSQIFKAGANGMMVGGYLTTGGRKLEDDLKMINDLGLEVKIKESDGRYKDEN